MSNHSTLLDDNTTEEYRGDSPEEGLKILSLFYMVGVLPVAALGILLNGIVFWVWMSSRKDKPTILLFQSLALWDSAYLLFEIARVVCFLSHDYDVSEYLGITRSLFQTGSIYTTLFIAVFRWLSVWKPFVVQRITRRHILAMCAVLLLWCGVTSGVYGYQKVEHMGNIWIIILVEVVRFVLPVVLLVGFSANLVWIVFKWCDKQGHGRAREAQKTTMTVLCIAGCSFVAYPVTFAAEAILFLDTNTDPNSKCWVCIGVLLGCSHLLQVINSGINIVFYVLVSTIFRDLLTDKFVRFSLSMRGTSRTASVTSPPKDVEL